MSEAGTKRAARPTPTREMTEADPVQPELFEEDQQTPEELAAEHQRQVEALTRESDENRRRAEEAARVAQSERVQREQAQQSAFTSQEKAIEGNIATQTQMITQAKQALRAARETGDFDAEEKAMEAWTGAQVQLSNLTSQKQYLDQLKAQQAQQPQRQQQQQQPQDQYRGPHGYSKASEEWIAQHPDFDSNPEFKTTVLQAAQAAMTSHAPDSYGYFKFIDAVVEERYGKKGAQQTNQQVQRRTPPASSMAAAPSRGGSSSSSNGQGPNPNVVAQKLGVTVQDLQDFARIAKMKFEDYVKDQATILEEERRGEPTGFYRGDVS